MNEWRGVRTDLHCAGYISGISWHDATIFTQLVGPCNGNLGCDLYLGCCKGMEYLPSSC